MRNEATAILRTPFGLRNRKRLRYQIAIRSCLRFRRHLSINSRVTTDCTFAHHRYIWTIYEIIRQHLQPLAVAQ